MTAVTAAVPAPAVTAMRHLARSMLRCSWAGALWGGDQLARLARCDDGTAGALDAVTLAARRRLSPLTQALFQAGDDLRRDWADLMPRDLRAASWRRFAGRLSSDLAGAITFVRPDAEGGAARKELLDKLEVYALVRRASASLAPGADLRWRFEDAVGDALRLDPWRALWVLEGLGHGHARAVLARDPDPVGLMVGARLPAAGQMMVHLGLGMALAEHVLADLDPHDAERTALAVERFLRLCRANSEPGQEDAARESFGLVARCFFPELVAPLDRALEERQEVEAGGLREYFWHGVGRALYFLPLHLVPGYGGIETALRCLEREAARGPAKAAGRSGVAYAATMVTLGRPEVLERFVQRRPDAVDPAFVEGMISAVLVRRDTTPEATEIATLLDHRPRHGGAEARRRWSRRIVEPLRAALAGGVHGDGAVARKLAGAREGGR